ncbi:arsenical-resistance protein ACR3 [Streptomyces sp. NL15-2K]|nr:arsenical-resistance protein ACR3 [Streptomyces sp. NL15-2K]
MAGGTGGLPPRAATNWGSGPRSGEPWSPGPPSIRRSRTGAPDRPQYQRGPVGPPRRRGGRHPRLRRLPDRHGLHWPLALALPDELAVAAVVVVAQTLVEVIGMVAYVRLIPRLVPEPDRAQVTAG